MKISSILFAAVLASILAAPTPFVSADGLPVYVCVAAMLFITGYFFSSYPDDPPAGDIGAYFVLSVALYGTIPLVTYLFREQTFAVTSDPRLLTMGIQPDDMVIHGWRHVAFLASFVVVYRFVRRPAEAPQAVNVPTGTVVVLLLVSAIAIQAAMILYFQTFGVSGSAYSEFNLSRAYGSSNAPLIVRQFADHMERGIIALKAALLVYLFTKRYLWVIGLWLGIEVVRTAITLHERTSLVLLLLSATMLYHRLVKPLKYTQCAILGGAAILAFVLFGSYRGFSDTPETSAARLLNHSNEFESVFTTSLDLWRRRALGALPEIPLQLYLADLVAIIPSQFLPFQKWAGPEFYLEMLRLRGLGQGLAWGVLSETAIGFGWVEIVARGAVIAYCFTQVHRWYVHRAANFWVTVCYVFACTNCYQTFRASSFQLVSLFWLEVLPVLIVPYLADRKRQRRLSPRQTPLRLTPSRLAVS